MSPFSFVRHIVLIFLALASSLQKTRTTRSTSLPPTSAGSGSRGACAVFAKFSPALTQHRFTGSAGQAIISRNNAYLVTDSRYWLQARDQVDSNWTIIEAGKPGQPKDWIDFLSVREKCHFLASIFIVFR